MLFFLIVLFLSSFSVYPSSQKSFIKIPVTDEVNSFYNKKINFIRKNNPEMAPLFTADILIILANPLYEKMAIKEDKKLFDIYIWKSFLFVYSFYKELLASNEFLIRHKMNQFGLDCPSDITNINARPFLHFKCIKVGLMNALQSKLIEYEKNNDEITLTLKSQNHLRENIANFFNDQITSELNAALIRDELIDAVDKDILIFERKHQLLIKKEDLFRLFNNMLFDYTGDFVYQNPLGSLSIKKEFLTLFQKKTEECINDSIDIEKYPKFAMSPEALGRWREHLWQTKEKTQKSLSKKQEFAVPLEYQQNKILIEKSQKHDAMQQEKKERDELTARKKEKKKQLEVEAQKAKELEEYEKKQQKQKRDRLASQAANKAQQEKIDLLEKIRKLKLMILEKEEIVDSNNSEEIRALLDQYKKSTTELFDSLNHCSAKDLNKELEMKQQEYLSQKNEFSQKIEDLEIQEREKQAKIAIAQKKRLEDQKKLDRLKFGFNRTLCSCLNNNKAILGSDQECIFCKVRKNQTDLERFNYSFEPKTPKRLVHNPYK